MRTQANRPPRESGNSTSSPGSMNPPLTAGSAAWESSEPVWIDTDGAGLILDCSETALLLLGYSFRGIRGRSLPIMFIENRPSGAALAALFRSPPVERTGVIRPRERRGVAVRFVMEVAADRNRPTGVLRWTFTDMNAERGSEISDTSWRQ